jgi:hypothetical protein
MIEYNGKTNHLPITFSISEAWGQNIGRRRYHDGHTADKLGSTPAA